MRRTNLLQTQRRLALAAAVSGMLVLSACTDDRRVVDDRDAGDAPMTSTRSESTTAQAGVAASNAGRGGATGGKTASVGAGGSSAAASGSGGAASVQPGAPGEMPARLEPTSDSGTPDPPEPRESPMPMLAEPPVRPTEPLAADQIFIPGETADAEALRRLTDWSQLPVLGTGRYLQRSSSDRKQPNDAEEMLFPLVAHDNRDLNNFVCKSADAKLGTSILGYHYDLETCPDAYVRGVTLARYEGSGELVRLWMTVSSISQPGGMLANEILRIYVDDNPRPLVQARLVDVMSGAAGEIFAPPFGAASDAFLAWYYPLVFGKKLVVAIDQLSSDYYFQTDVVLDAEPKARFAPLARLDERDHASAQLRAATPAPEAKVLGSESITLARDQPRSVKLTGPATIQELRLRVASDKLASLASVRVSVRWDAAEKSAMDLSLLDLFAARRAVVARGNLALASSLEGGEQVLSLRLPMPFKTSAEWTFRQTGDGNVDFKLEWLGAAQVPEATFGYLNVQQNEAPLPAMQLDQPVARASGRGRFIGMCADLEGRADSSLGLFGTSPLNFLEGDVRAMVDGQLALDGTGTEDYPDNAFYFRDTPKATPFSQSWDLVNNASSTPPGQVSFCRWQVLGSEVDFQSDFSATHELAIGDASIVDLHRTIAFLYLE
ncbi:MAG TPA: DUF2961 domain-containing protein [Polyangiales bacterium]|nr:DUF2961 domain-containing protein [Polyangiales bacterium]